MTESLLPAVVSNALVASGIGLFAWLGSRIYRHPSLWHTVWVLALLKLFLPPIWSVSALPTADSSVTEIRSEVTNEISPNRETAIHVDNGRARRESVSANTRSSRLPAKGSDSWHTLRRSWKAGLVCIWVSGALTVLTASTYRIQRFHKCVRGGVAADSVTEELVSEMAATLSLTASRPHVRLVDFTLPPLLWPIGRKPSIVLPLRWWEIVSLSERRTVVMHELIHWRRGDHWIRLLQWISSIAFWWHPVVWVARRELHRIEEQCCDAEVMHRLPGEGRAYASAMLSASQWLSEAAPDLSRHESSVLAMPMSYSDCFESFRRRIEMLPTLHHRPLRGPGLITILLTMSLPLSIGIGAHGQDSDPAQAGSQNDSSQSAVVTGTVTDTDGVPLAKAAVRVVIPAVDLRMYDIRRSALQNASREVLGHTDDLGKYSLQVPAITEQTTASIDILHPGHRRLSGTYRSGGDPNTLTLSPGKNVQFDVQLRKAMYFAGQVLGEDGKPIEGVLVHSSLITKRSSGGIEMTRTDTEGRFAVYGYEEKFFVQNTEQDIYTARIFFFDDRYIHAELRELESVALPMRGALRVVLRAGCTVSGTVKGTDGMPVPDIAVSITDTQDNPLSFEMNRKEGRTDSRGQFSFAGIDSGKATLRVVDVQGNRKSIQELTISETKQEVVVTLEDFKPPIESTHKVLGMTMASVTDEMDQAYDLQRQNTKGVMIIDPGDRFEDFGIGQLRSGDVFWMVGNDAVHDLRTMVRQMVKEAQSPTVPRGASGNRNTSAWILEDGTAMVGVVYGYNDDRGHGTNTQYMKLTPQDVTELEQLLSVLAAGTDD